MENSSEQPKNSKLLIYSKPSSCKCCLALEGARDVSLVTIASYGAVAILYLLREIKQGAEGRLHTCLGGANRRKRTHADRHRSK